MKRNVKAQYHCCFLLDKAGSLHMAVAWARMGACDYGVYLTRRTGAVIGGPLFTYFKAIYTPHGDIVSFVVADKVPVENEKWDEDHVLSAAVPKTFNSEDLSNVSLLSSAFFGDWLESFGESDAHSLVKSFGFKFDEGDAWVDLLNSGLPIEVRKSKLTDVLSVAQTTDQGYLYCFIPFPERVGELGPVELLESKLQKFFELL